MCTDSGDGTDAFVMNTITAIRTNVRGLHNAPNNASTMITVLLDFRHHCPGVSIHKVMPQNDLKSNIRFEEIR